MTYNPDNTTPDEDNEDIIFIEEEPVNPKIEHINQMIAKADDILYKVRGLIRAFKNKPNQ